MPQATVDGEGNILAFNLLEPLLLDAKSMGSDAQELESAFTLVSLTPEMTVPVAS